jgi:hypothetical protein
MEVIMASEMPDNLTQYFKAQNAHDLDAMAATFAPQAEVKDESRVYVGREAIRAWTQETSAKYRVTVEPLSTTRQGDAVTVVAKVSGNFPGSPANLNFDFVLDPAGLIQRLEVH